LQPESHFPEKHHAPRQLTPTGTGSESQPQFNRQLLQQGGPSQQVNTSYYQHSEAHLARFQLQCVHYTFVTKQATEITDIPSSLGSWAPVIIITLVYDIV